jgi:hypothetical protein
MPKFVCSTYKKRAQRTAAFAAASVKKAIR